MTTFSVISDLYQFVDDYESWSYELQATLPQIKPALSNAAAGSSTASPPRSVACAAASTCWHQTNIRTSGHAFALANRAMLMQMVHADGRLQRAGASTLDRSPAGRPRLHERDAVRQLRPFQLAFLLLTLASAALDDSADRGVVDLIWFPTGVGRQRPTSRLRRTPSSLRPVHRRGLPGLCNHRHHPLHPSPPYR